MKIPKVRQLPSGAYFCQLRIDGQSISITGDSADEVEAKAYAYKAGLLEIKKKPPKITLGQAVDNYVDKRVGIVSPSTIRSYRIFRRIRFQELMDKPVDNLTANMIQRSISNALVPGEDGKALSAKTIKDMVGTLKSVLKESDVDLDLSKLVLPKVQPSPYATLDPEEIKILLKAIKGDPCEVYILLALWLGLRRSEIVALEKSDFDFKHGTVTISSALVKDENNKLVAKGTKTASSVRVLSCPQYILDMVKKLPDGKIYGMDVGTILKVLHRVCRQNDLPQIRLHDLRHVNASIMLMLNIPDKYAMERGGWSSKQTMTGRYQHTFSNEKKRVDDKINDYFQGLLVEGE